MYCDQNEDVQIEQWEPNASVTFNTPGGAEIFVLDGGFHEGSDELRTLSWLRIPVNGKVDAKAGSDGARVWIKANHLAGI